jgi:hypothetical protein
LRKQKFRSRTRAIEVAGANERVCEECPTVCALMTYRGLLELMVVLVLFVKDLEAIQGDEFIHFID